MTCYFRASLCEVSRQATEGIDSGSFLDYRLQVPKLLGLAQGDDIGQPMVFLLSSKLPSEDV